MELNWSTFILEIINFLILVWFLKHFFYRPILGVIERRRSTIEQTLEEAKTIRSKAEAMEQQYQNRLREWEKEKAAALEKLRHELNAERERQVAALRNSLEAERERAQVLLERNQNQARRKDQAAALERTVRFASQLLSRLAGPELEAKLVALVLEDLTTLPLEQQENLREILTNTTAPIKVASAYPLEESKRQTLQTAFHRLAGKNPNVLDFRQDPELIAGLRISIGPWILRANLQDELSYFAEATHGRLE